MHLLMAAPLSFSHCKFITYSVEDAVQVAQAAQAAAVNFIHLGRERRDDDDGGR